MIRGFVPHLHPRSKACTGLPRALVAGALLALGICAALAWAGCGPAQEAGQQPSSETPKPKPPRVAATTYPLGFLVTRLAGDWVDLQMVLPADGDPAHGTPTTEQLLDLQNADLVIAHGAGYEQWMITASLPETKVSRTAEQLDLLSISGRTHSHGKQGEHSHTGTDPRAWLDPDLFQRQAERVQQVLAEQWPNRADSTEQRLSELKDQLRAIDHQLEELLGAGPASRWSFWAADPDRYGYWQRRYGIQIQHLKMSSPADMSSAGGPELDPQSPVLWISGRRSEAPPTDTRCAAAIDLLSRPSDGAVYDYLGQAKANLARLRSAFDQCPEKPD